MKKTGKKRGFSTGGEEPITGGKTVGCPMKEQLKKTGESRLFAENGDLKCLLECLNSCRRDKQFLDINSILEEYSPRSADRTIKSS